MPKTKAERMRAHRARKREGVVCLARVPVYEADVAALVERGLLRAEDTGNVARVSDAVEGLVDDFTEGHGAGAVTRDASGPGLQLQPRNSECREEEGHFSPASLATLPDGRRVAVTG